MAVAFSEDDGSPRINYNEGEITLTRVLRCAWSDSIAFFNELIGGYQLVGGSFVFTPPATFPGVPYAIPKNISVVGFPNNPVTPAGELLVSTNQFQQAIFTVQYGMMDAEDNASRSGLPSVPAGTRLRYSQDVGSEYVTIPGNNVVWYDDGEPVDDAVNVGVLVPTIDFSLVWDNVPSPPWGAIAELSGKVNETEFNGYPPETVLFLGARSSIEYQFDQAPKWTLDYQFKGRFVKSTVSASDDIFGWNHFFRKEAIAGEHWLKVSDEDLNPPYRTGDLNELFVFG